MGAVVGGVVLAAVAFTNAFAPVGAALLVGTGILMRPRLGKPPDEGVVERSRAPTLHDVVERTAAALGTPTVDMVVVDHEFNASWAVLGVRRRRVLTLGLPLLTAVGPQERVALVAHELAHARNGDATRGLFVGSAVRALAELYWLLAPEELSGELDWDLGAFERIVNGFLWLVSRPAYGLLLLELHLLLRDAQRAEYLADALAADVAGTEAAVALQEKMLLEPTLWSAVKAASRPGANGQRDVFALLSEAVAGVPERERERRRRAARLEGARLSDSHPPTAKRIDLLERREQKQPRVVLDAAASARIDAELASLRAAFGRRLVDEYRDTLYAS
ncbi:MAG: M48 family metallopeptidase [Actinomycetota bacterium]|nr:M48 family metallopeptidase [Actinomycetota bacterium]